MNCWINTFDKTLQCNTFCMWTGLNSCRWHVTLLSALWNSTFRWSFSLLCNIAFLFSLWKAEELKNESRNDSSQPYQSLSDHSDEVGFLIFWAIILWSTFFQAQRQVCEWGCFILSGNWWTPSCEKEDHPALLIGWKRQSRKAERRPEGQEGQWTRRRWTKITDL